MWKMYAKTPRTGRGVTMKEMSGAFFLYVEKQNQSQEKHPAPISHLIYLPTILWGMTV